VISRQHAGGAHLPRAIGIRLEAIVVEWIADPAVWASLLTLTVLEIVLGIDNIIFISIVASRLPLERQPRARQFGLAAALLTRLVLLASIVWITKLTSPLFTLFDHTVSWRDIVLIVGGLFLLVKGTLDIHQAVDVEHERQVRAAAPSFAAVITQIALLDVVFSLDSVITAIGMAQHLPVMVAAVVIAMAVMLFAAGPVSAFINRHPTVKMLALSFLLLIGMALVADGLQFHIPKGYLYFAVAFAILVESLNLAAAGRRARKAAARAP
jgi:predicted tellurium resistance membrane protein TerC